jgi:Uma2 family endonuclease
MVIRSTEQRLYTSEEYLEREIDSEEKHEYIDEEIILMPGGMPNHTLLPIPKYRQYFRRRDRQLIEFR